MVANQIECLQPKPTALPAQSEMSHLLWWRRFQRVTIWSPDRFKAYQLALRLTDLEASKH